MRSNLLGMTLKEVSHPEDDVALSSFLCSPERLQCPVCSVDLREVLGVALLVACRVTSDLCVSALDLHTANSACHSTGAPRDAGADNDDERYGLQGHRRHLLGGLGPDLAYGVDWLRRRESSWLTTGRLDPRRNRHRSRVRCYRMAESAHAPGTVMDFRRVAEQRLAVRVVAGPLLEGHELHPMATTDGPSEAASRARLGCARCAHPRLHGANDIRGPDSTRQSGHLIARSLQVRGSAMDQIQ